MELRTALKKVSVVVVTSGVVSAMGVSARADAAPLVPQPLTMIPIVAEAGYFSAQGVCPKRTASVRYTWTGAPNGAGWGLMQLAAGPFSVPVRLLAATPIGDIVVTLRCRHSSGRTLAILGPTVVTSGNALLPLPTNAGLGRRIVYSISSQQVWVVEADETVARTFLVSGRRLPLSRNRPQTGSFAVRSKSRTGCKFPVRCPNMIRFHAVVTGEIGFHAIPIERGRKLQTPAELGQPRSHGCVRVAPEDAEWLFNRTVKGDAVVVIP